VKKPENTLKNMEMVMSDWGNYIAAPIETYHDEANSEFHGKPEFDGNVKYIDGTKYINGIEFNRLIAAFKSKIMKTYRIKSDAIPVTSKITNKEDRKIIQDQFYEIMSREPSSLKNTSPETYKKLKQQLKQKDDLIECMLLAMENITVKYKDTREIYDGFNKSYEILKGGE
jgi:hypothetical protein